MTTNTNSPHNPNWDSARDAAWGAAQVDARAAATRSDVDAATAALLEALKAYRAARAMPSTGDYAAIPWEYKGGPRDPGWGGGDCEKHGRWYGSRCSSCYADLEKLREQADRDAVHARDNALRAADEKARAIIASIEGQHLDCRN